MNKFILIALFVLSHFYGLTQLNMTQKSEVIDSLLNECYKREIFNGAVLVADQGEVILHKSYGVSDVENKIKLKTNTRFYIGGLTKQFTAALIYKLYQQKKIDIYKPFNKYLPEFNNKKFKNITVYHLLTHTSGLFSYDNYFSFDNEKNYSTSEVYEMIKSESPKFKAGESYEYCNSGYYLLGKILEKLSRKSYAQMLKNEILDPLKMNNTAYDTVWLTENVAHGYSRAVNGFEKSKNVSLSTLFSSGGMYSTAQDLFKWDQALYGVDILSDEIKNMMFTPFFNEHASAWRVDKGYDENSNYFEQHQLGGIKQGFNTYVLRLVPQKQTIIILDNFYNPEMLDIKNSIWAVLDNRQGWVPRSMLSVLLYKKIIQGRLPQTVSWLEQNRADYERIYVFEEFDINQVGYKLFRLKRLDEAIQIFEFNMHLFPDAWNVYDSYAEILLELGELQKSKRMYQKSLELNPENENAQLKINEIDTLKY